MNLNINFAGLTNAELLGFGQSLDVILSPLSNILTIYQPFKDALTLCEQSSANIISKKISQEDTQEIASADSNRDNLFRGLKHIVQAYILYPDEEKKTAALQLEKVIDKVGWNLHRENYDQQSALMKTLFTDIENNYTGQLALLGLTDFFTILKESQETFDTLRQTQLEKQSGLSQLNSMTEVRGQLEQACKDLLEILPGYYRMTSDEELGAALPKISELIARTR